MDPLSLVNSILSMHKAESWNNMTAGTEVHLEEMRTSSQEFSSVSNKIRQTLPVTVNTVVRVQNPYLFGKYHTATTCSLTDELTCHVSCTGTDSTVHTAFHVDFLLYMTLTN
jgi:hypothetical protein